MINRSFLKQPAIFFQCRHNIFIRIFDVFALEIRYRVDKYTIRIKWTRDTFTLIDHIRCQTNSVIILTKCRCLMHNTCTAFLRYIGIGQHLKSTIFVTLVKIREQRFVSHSNQFTALNFLQNFMVIRLLPFLHFLVIPLNTFLGNDESFISLNIK